MPDFLTALHAIIIFESLLLAVFLLRQPSGGNACLAVFLLALAAQITASAVIAEGTALARWDPRSVIALVFGPAVWFYVLRMTGTDLPPLLQRWVHAAPAGLALIGLAFGVTATPLIGIAIYSSLLAYMAASVVAYRRYRDRIRHEYATLDRISAPWLAQFLGFFGCILVIDAFENIVGCSGVLPSDELLFALLLLALAGFTALIVWRTLEHPIPAAVDEPERHGKYHYSDLSEADLDTFQQKVRAYMQAEKPHLREQIVLGELASELAMTPRELSQTINARFGQNFSEFIGRYRVIEAQRLLADPDQAERSILDIMMASGFSSKSAFNRAFKSVAGMTPSAYRESQ